jgi:prophage regulatory protein
MKLLRISDACAVTGDKRSSFYRKVMEGLITKPVKIGCGRAVAWPDTELEAINYARLAGKTDVEIRELVTELDAQRTRERARYPKAEEKHAAGEG